MWSLILWTACRRSQDAGATCPTMTTRAVNSRDLMEMPGPTRALPADEAAAGAGDRADEAVEEGRRTTVGGASISETVTVIVEMTGVVATDVQATGAEVTGAEPMGAWDTGEVPGAQCRRRRPTADREAVGADEGQVRFHAGAAPRLLDVAALRRLIVAAGARLRPPGGAEVRPAPTAMAAVAAVAVEDLVVAVVATTT
mmetsp:Transcript_34461/g.55356  ORF Transcript_34461/g.55356 Transcript_34461/m.55356 type:complete len:199 (+) Transcript_34461:245-841(+)